MVEGCRHCLRRATRRPLHQRKKDGRWRVRGFGVETFGVREGKVTYRRVLIGVIKWTRRVFNVTNCVFKVQVK
jgi:hypothetical protein